MNLNPSRLATAIQAAIACLIVSLLLTVPFLAWAADLTIVTSAKTGVVYTMADLGAATSYTFTNDGRTLLLLTGDDDTTATITIVTGATMGGYEVANQSVVVAPLATQVVGPFNTSVFNDSTGKVTVTGDDSTTITVAAIKLGTN